MEKILLVDDKPASLKMLSKVISRRYEVFSATNFVEVKRCLDTMEPHVLIIDANMKTTDSFQMIEKIRKSSREYRNIPVVFLIKNPVSELVRKATSLGAVDVEIKPVEPLAFYNKIEKALQLAIPVKDRLDEATGLHKKQHTEEKIQLKMVLGEVGTMVMIDVDSLSFVSTNLKPDVLIRVSEEIKTQLEIIDGVVGVMGASSFIGFLPDAVDKEKTKKWAEQLIEKIHGCSDKKLYVSIGLAINNGQRENYADLYIECDRALNLARQNNKNRACYYN